MPFKSTAAASNGKGAVLLAEHQHGGLVLLRYAPAALGQPTRAQEFRALFRRAAAKLGYRPSRTAPGGWAR